MNDRTRPRTNDHGLSRAAIAVALTLVGCTATPPATPSATLPGSATAQPSTADADTVLTTRVVAGGGFGTLDPPAERFFSANAEEEYLQSLVMSSLYRYDDQFRPTPDLAAEPCEVAGDGLTITCRLRDAWFHDGSPVRAADVVFSFSVGAAGLFEAARAVDEQTVRFTVDSPDATFIDHTLARVPIGPRRLHEAAFRQLMVAARGLPADASERLASIGARLEEARASAEPEVACGDVLAEIDELRATAPSLLPDELLAERIAWLDLGSPCETSAIVQRLLLQIADAREAPDAEYVPDAHLAVAVHVPRIGSGPFRVERHTPGVATILAAHERHHHGRPALDRIVVRVIPDENAATDAMRDGEIDLLRVSEPPDDASRFEALRDVPDVAIATYSSHEYVALQFNVRAGQLFHERELRKALELCIDKTALVDAATRGTAMRLDGPLLPIHWAAQVSGGDAPERDVAAARELIESAGWSAGQDGTYARGEERLATELWVSAEQEERVHFAELVADRARDCGMELTPRPAAFADLLTMLYTPPHPSPGNGSPFDLYLGAWAFDFEPHFALELIFHSERIPSEPATQELQYNYVGYSNPAFDELIDAARVTYDQFERARLYREAQQILADDLPYLFVWSETHRSYFTSALSSAAGPLQLDSALWDWQFEDLTLESTP